MQFTNTFVKLLTLSAAALAHPAAEQGTDLILFDEEGVKSMGMHVEHRAALEVRDDYSTVATVIESIGTIREELCMITFGYYTSRFVCNNMGWNDCDALAGAVAAASYGITLIAQRASGARAVRPEVGSWQSGCEVPTQQSIRGQKVSEKRVRF
ncbi:hypothetical protein G7054_g2115 [Neopestalotiopsis clavispora]|nr:hypothetical protein G7054_g2115 [Neopestalotiopsis clavispora]